MAARPARSENDMISMISEMAGIIEKLTAQLENKDRLIEDLNRKIATDDMNHHHQILRLVEEISLRGGGADSARGGGSYPAPGDATSARGSDTRSGGGADSARGGGSYPAPGDATSARGSDTRSGGGADSARGGDSYPARGGDSYPARGDATSARSGGAAASARSGSAAASARSGSAAASAHSGTSSSSDTVLRAARCVLFGDGHREARSSTPHAFVTNGSNEKPLAAHEAHTKTTMHRILTSAGAPRCSSD